MNNLKNKSPLKTIFAFILTSIIQLGYSQLVLPVEHFFKDYNSFNVDFIKKNKIRSIQLTYSEKMDGEIIVSKPAIKRFYFNQEGRPTKEVYIESRGIYKDSSTIYFKFNDSNLLSEELITYQSETITRAFNYNAKNRVQSIVTTKHYKGQEDTVSIERYKEPYSDESFAKRIYLNSENRPYLEERLYYENNRIIREEKDLIITSKSSTKSWSYKGHLIDKIEYSNYINRNEKGVYQFEYVNQNHLEYAYLFIEGELEKKLAFVYSPDDSDHLEALVIRYEQEGKIEIIQLEYTYY